MKAILVVLTGMLLCMLGCQDGTIPSDNVGDADAHEFDVGELHNDIARAFAAKLDETSSDESDEPITRKEFVKLMVEASNETFTAQGIPSAITARDINTTLNEFVDLRNRGVFDIYGEQPGDPVRIIDDWEMRGMISALEAGAVRARLNGDPDAYSLPSTERVEMMDRVWVASERLWSDPGFVLKGRSRPSALDVDGTPDKASMSRQIDSIFLLFGAFFWGRTGATVGGTVSSLIFEMFPPSASPGESWDCSDYCNMG